MGHGMPGMKAPSKNPQCGQMDIRSSITMGKTSSALAIKVLEVRSVHRFA